YFEPIQPHSFLDLHKVTMRETSGRTIKGVRYILSKRFHCIHSHTVKLKQEKHNNSETNIERTRMRDTNCSATSSIQLLKRTDPYPCIITLYFHHNHPLGSSHVTGFRPISDKTKDELFKLFENGHNPSSAYHTYWEQLQIKCDNDEEILADRAIAPCKNDVFYLYKKHRDQYLGAQNGEDMFDRLEKEVAEFNHNNKGNA
ncbi:8206_t:CDS:2, partial [Cetraspora pellucida]